MNPEHEHFTQWDGAYAVGALSPTERRLFEAHLEDCELCRRAVGELGPTVGLMSRISNERASAIDAWALDEQDAAAGPSTDLRDAIVSVARHRRRRRRRIVWVVSAAAAALLIVCAVAVPVALQRSAPRESYALEAVIDVPLKASVALTGVAWGTRLDLECSYASDGGSESPAEGRPYSLIVIGADGQASTVSTWRALPGSTARLSAATALDADQISAIEIRSLTSDRILMRHEFDPPAP